MILKCLAIDDEPLALQQLVNYISKVPFLELAAECHSAIEARKYLQNNTVEVMFCDINMPDLNGLDFVRSLQAPPLVVFTTAYAEYAVDGFRVDAVDYLLKPFSLDEFKRASERARERLAGRGMQDLAQADSNKEEEDVLFVKTDYRMVKIIISDITYIEGMSEYLKIYTRTQQKPIISLIGMKKLEERLPDYFMRIHRSYIINLREIEVVSRNRVTLANDVSLPISESYRGAFNEFVYKKFLGK